MYILLASLPVELTFLFHEAAPEWSPSPDIADTLLSNAPAAVGQELGMIPACSWCQISLVGASTASAVSMAEAFGVNSGFVSYFGGKIHVGSQICWSKY